MRVLLVIYVVSLLVAGALGTTGVYHARKFGLPHDKTRLATVIYFLLAGTIIVISLLLIATADWSGETV